MRRFVPVLVFILVFQAPDAWSQDDRDPQGSPAAEDNGKPLKECGRAGQSNKEGHGFVDDDPKRNNGKGSLEYLTKGPATADQFKHLRGKDGGWAPRDDVWIHYLGRKGKLKA